MPKMKTHQGGAKRLRRTSGGKLQRRRAADSHNFEHKSQDSKREKRGLSTVAAADHNRAKRLLVKG